MIERPASVPKEGEIETFDAGWYAQEVGLGRDTVILFCPDPMAILAWDIRHELERRERDQNPTG